jgi:RNA polymerase sigma factor (sigma-70 family)
MAGLKQGRNMKTEHEFEGLCLSFTPLIKKTIRYLGLQWDYQEAFQIGLIALWEAWRDFDPQKGFFPTYAKAKIIGRLKTLATKSYTDRERFQPFTLSEDDIQEQEKDTGEFTFDLEACKFSQKERLWVAEFINEGYNTEEIAARHDVSVNTVRSWKKGVKRKLHAYLTFR